MNFQRGAIIIVPVFLGILAGVGALSSARAAELQQFVIPANDAYGVQDCLAEGSECGQIVADAWCQAHGRGSAQSFGPQSAFIGVGATKISTAPEPYVINCGQ